VWELYLPEEYDACGVAYGLYAKLSEADRAKLNAGARITLDTSVLTRDQTQILAAWFNSARWGCDPPAEHLDSAGVAKSALVLTCQDNVVELALRSPQKGIWKKLAIACAPEKAEWVRDGLPLLPSWFEEPWDGGTRPPEPARKPPWDMSFHDYVILRGAYRVYAELPATLLRKLHRSHNLEIAFSDLSPSAQQSLAAAFDEHRFQARAFGVPDSYGRPARLREGLYGITSVRFSYAGTCPDLEVPSPQGGTGLERFPRPHRVVYMEYDPLVPTLDGRKPATWDNPPVSSFVHGKMTYLIAWPPDIQRRVLAWQLDVRDWLARWQYKEGSRTYNKPGAPPFPSDPWGGTTQPG
jgi:hypothetical protein